MTTTNSIHAAFTARAAVGGYVVAPGNTRSVLLGTGASMTSGPRGPVTTK
jgi:hypothetical protein